MDNLRGLASAHLYAAKRIYMCVGSELFVYGSVIPSYFEVIEKLNWISETVIGRTTIDSLRVIFKYITRSIYRCV